MISQWWTQVSTTVTQGLSITALGMALVFFTLGLVIVAMVLLTKIPWLRAKEAGETSTEAPLEDLAEVPGPVEAASLPSAPTDEFAQIAAIAVALLRTRRGVRARVDRPTAARSAWKSYGRAHQHGL
jgi:Na+-transporting methylmalonyl-CoA/oxaloacetate decarboxylase gamma subunit